MSRTRNRRNVAEPLNPLAHEEPSKEDRTDHSVIRQVSHPTRVRTLSTGFPFVGEEVLEAVGSNGTIGRAMHDVLYTPDDEKVVTRLGPEEEASVAFHSDPALGDAGAEFAETFGRDFLMAATMGEDIREIEGASTTDPSEVGGPFLEESFVDGLEDLTEDAEPADD
ncbi:MAG TPA: hypothetical protein VK540_18840 [Polyangiaceae bacterium]|jgi:hypothetical protein|nr:hypothetical protein [Polyangiaceae bacterium]